METKHKTLDKLYIELKRRESMSDFSIPTETVRVYLDEFYAELYASEENRKKDEPKQSDPVDFVNYLHEEGYEWGNKRYQLYRGGKFFWIKDIFTNYLTSKTK